MLLFFLFIFFFIQDFPDMYSFLSFQFIYIKFNYYNPLYGILVRVNDTYLLNGTYAQDHYANPRVNREKKMDYRLKLLILISGLRTNQARYDKSAIINDRLHFERSDIICAIHSPAISRPCTIHDGRLVVWMHDRWRDEWGGREEKRACYRMTIRDWNCLSGKRYDWTSLLTARTADGFVYYFRWNIAEADDTTKIETFRSQFGISKWEDLLYRIGHFSL